MTETKKTPERRASDRKGTKIVGWIACFALAASLTYTFVKALTEGPDQVDPLFFALQSLASLLFLVYSLKLKNMVFVAANCVALANAAGTLVVVALGR
ncbi:MAG TPA: hypothetical protein VM890_01780 [Longimicrobium sp.]|nr:hypothetical protein [Longimicrobium sp.]